MTVVILAIAFAWMLQLIMSLLQIRRYHRDHAELRKLGPVTGTGVAGKNWTLKKYGVLVMDDDRNVVAARKLTGITVFHGLKDVPQLAGMNIERFEDTTPVKGISKKLWKAFMEAAVFIRKHDREAAEAAETVEVVEQEVAQ